MKITIKKGDTNSFKEDAIVNTTNDKLWIGGRFAGAIERVGGQKIERRGVPRGLIPIFNKNTFEKFKRVSR